MDTYAIRLRWAMDNASPPRSQSELAREIGVKPQSIQYLCAELKHAGGSIHTSKIADALGVNAIWLATGKGPRRKSDTANITPGPDIKGLVPLVSWVQAGAWCETIDIFEPGAAEEWMPCPAPHGSRTFVLRVRGPSMHNPHGKPSFQDGDLIFVDPDREAVNGSPVVVRLDDENDATFKQLVIEGDRRYLRALNPAWPEQIIQVNGNATICGVVIGKWERV